MIEKLFISNLKAIKNLSIDCSNINLLVGTNSSGKSTVLQALLLLAQNINYTNSGLNGKLVRLGNFDEAKCKFSREPEIRIQANTQLSEYKFSFKRFDEHGKTIGEEVENRSPQFMSIDSRSFQYVSCNRIGPQNIYMKNMDIYETMGIDSEYAISFLNTHGADQIESSLCKDMNDFTLLGQVNWWLKYIVDATISTEEIPRADAITVSYSGGKSPVVLNGEIKNGTNTVKVNDTDNISSLTILISDSKNQTQDSREIQVGSVTN